MYKNFPGAFKAVEGEEEKETKKLKTGGSVTISDDGDTRTYSPSASIQKLMDAGMSRKEAEAEMELSMKAGSQRTTGDQ